MTTFYLRADDCIHLSLSRVNTLEIIIGKKKYPITSYKPVYSWITPNGKSRMCCPLSREDILVHVKSNEAYTSIEVYDINKNYFYTCT